MKHRFFALMLSFVMALALLCVPALAYAASVDPGLVVEGGTEGVDYDVNPSVSGTEFVVKTSTPLTFKMASDVKDGDTASGRIKIKASTDANITIDNVQMETFVNAESACISLDYGATLQLTLRGLSTLVSNVTRMPAIVVDSYASLTILEDFTNAGVNLLEAYATQSEAAGIGGYEGYRNGNITIQGNVHAFGGKYSAGIGGSYCSGSGIIKVLSGEVYAVGGEDGAGIGSGRSGSAGEISIEGGVVYAYGNNNAAGIGTGGRDYNKGSCTGINIKGGKVYAAGGDNGPGLGLGTAYAEPLDPFETPSGGNVSYFEGATLEAKTGNPNNAGIQAYSNAITLPEAGSYMWKASTTIDRPTAEYRMDDYFTNRPVTVKYAIFTPIADSVAIDPATASVQKGFGLCTDMYFALNNYNDLSGDFKVYSAATGDELAQGVTAALDGLSSIVLSHATDVPVGDYYVTHTESYKRESARVKLTVTEHENVYYNVSVSANPAAGGTVTADPLPEDGKYLEQTKVTFTATPSSALYEFMSWSITPEVNDLDLDNPEITLDIMGDTEVVAEFIYLGKNPSKDDNKIMGVASEYTKGDTVDFSVYGGGMKKKAAVDMEGDKRWRPVSWMVDRDLQAGQSALKHASAGGEFTDPDYTAQFTTEAMTLGEHTLVVTFLHEVYTGTQWINFGTYEVDEKTVTFTLIAPPDPDPVVTIGESTITRTYEDYLREQAEKDLMAPSSGLQPDVAVEPKTGGNGSTIPPKATSTEADHGLGDTVPATDGTTPVMPPQTGDSGTAVGFVMIAAAMCVLAVRRRRA